MGWWAQVRASKATRVLGGVLAGVVVVLILVVGYGKAAIVVALIHDQRERAVQQETEEATIVSWGWRAQVRASKATRVLGGVLADVVGYGKTAMVVTLIHEQTTWSSSTRGRTAKR